MKKKEPQKLLLALVTSDEIRQSAADMLSTQVNKSFKTTDLVIPIIQKALRHNFLHEFDQPIQLGEHQVRHFFSNVDRGVKAVQHYIGKKLSTRQEAIDYFINHIGVKAYGSDWLLDEVVKFFKSEKPGLFLVTDLSLAQAQKLKPELTGSLKILYVGEDQPAKVDVAVAPPFSKSVMRRITTQLQLNKPNNKSIQTNQGEENERTAS